MHVNWCREFLTYYVRLTYLILYSTLNIPAMKNTCDSVSSIVVADRDDITATSNVSCPTVAAAKLTPTHRVKTDM